MNIGIFVTSLTPGSAAQARFQSTIFGSLRKLSPHQFSFKVLCPEIPAGFQDDGNIQYFSLERDGRFAQLAYIIRSNLSRIFLLCCQLLGISNDSIVNAMARWSKYEPKYYRQLRDLNIRLLWNMNQHELPTELPFIRTIWDVNHRIYSMYPEYSYSRFTFDGCDRNMQISLARASYVIVGTEEGKRQVIDIFGADHGKVRIIPFPVPEIATSGECSEATSNIIAKGRYIFYPARFWPHKNHIVILEAMKILRDKRNIDLRCVFSGTDEGNLRYVFDNAERLGLKTKVDHAGLVPESDLRHFYKNAFALVYASAVGPDNLPPLEAMAADCPVVTAEVRGAREQYGDAALYFDPMNEEELAERVKELAGNELLREKLVERGRTRAASWTAEDYVRSVNAILDEFARVARAWERCDAQFT